VGGTSIEEAVGWAVSLGPRVDLPGAGATRRRWEVLATVAAVDVTLARVIEPHLDALAILAEAHDARAVGAAFPVGSSWGVYAAEGPGPRLEAAPGDGRWTLHGVKPWCSLAAEVSHALVTAWRPEGVRGLFAVDLGHPGVRTQDATWAPTGLREVVSTPVEMTAVPATEVGGPHWYLERDGFAWGGLGVAAVWYGGAVGVARRLRDAAGRREPDQVMQMHLGAVHAALARARALLAETADDVDAGRVTGSAGFAAATTARQVVADTAEEVLSRAGHALGPGPLTQDAAHARRVADLTLYLRQHHAERDQAALGRMLLDGGTDVTGADAW
jgi:alkylation response protein AidB-like acyl-CoA dehydrogenase